VKPDVIEKVLHSLRAYNYSSFVMDDCDMDYRHVSKTFYTLVGYNQSCVDDNECRRKVLEKPRVLIFFCRNETGQPLPHLRLYGSRIISLSLNSTMWIIVQVVFVNDRYRCVVAGSIGSKPSIETLAAEQSKLGHSSTSWRGDFH
jgi:hypothetical protein